jgi:NAD(P)-dependent dehydrogenase (short-subunit alcohol dehydrogenase family)
MGADMKNANVLITGASSGFGKLIAEALADEGHQVFAGMRALNGRNAAVAVELAVRPARHRIIPVEIDVTNDAAVDSGVATALKAGGRIDVLINCAGIMWLGPREAYSVEQFERLLQTNLIGPFRLFKAVLPGMRARRDGLLITITSVAGRAAAPGFGIYASSKLGLEALAEVLGYEVAGLGVDSVIVEPGPFPTTNLMASQTDPAGANVVAEYGEYGRFRERTQRQARAIGGVTPSLMDPMLVAHLVRDLIAAPKGGRPVRQTVGLDFGLTQLNDATRVFQGGFLSALGADDLERVRAEEI